MESILRWGLDVIQWVQQIQSPLLNSIFGAITVMGGGRFFIFLLPLVFWCIDYKLGLRLIFIYAVSGFFNFYFKDFFAQPRPFVLDPGVGIATARGYGFPSGHAQGSLVLWGCIAAWVKKKWFWALVAVMVALIGFSRVYLGVHFPTDVMAGWLLGLVFLLLYLVLRQRVEAWISAQSPGGQILWGLALPLVLVFIHPGRAIIRTLGILAGVVLGAVLKTRCLPFSVGGAWWMRLARYLIGLPIMFGLFFVFAKVYPARQTTLYLVVGFFHAALIGVWISLGAPWLFRLLRLASAGEVQEIQQNRRQCKPI